MSVAVFVDVSGQESGSPGRGGGCAGTLAERASHDARWVALGALGRTALVVAGVVAVVRRGKRRCAERGWLPIWHAGSGSR